MSTHRFPGRAGFASAGAVALLAVFVTAASVQAQGTPASVPSASAGSSAGAAATAPFDGVAATRATLAKVPADKRARSDAYFEGGYWLQLWDFLLGAALSLVLLGSRLSAKMRDLCERLTRRKPIQTFLYWLQYLVLTSVVLFPMTVYEGFVREHRYGLATQDFGGWLGDQGKGLALGALMGGLALVALYGVVRKAPRSWWVWGAVTAIALTVVASVIAPVFIAPVFNKYTRLTDPAVREPILRMARAQGIDVNDVFVFDASRQSTRVSANVSGLLGTERISLNDNLLDRCTLAEIEATMGHEMGHYVLHHVYKSTLFFAVLLVIGFAFLSWSFEKIVAKKGEAWGIRGPGDVAGLPLFVLLISVFFFVLTPLTNSHIRVQEAEADLFGLNASGQPDGEAEIDLKLGEYRKLDPGPLEEILFFDHPGGRSRILMAMKWKAEHLADAERNAAAAAVADRARAKPKG